MENSGAQLSTIEKSYSDLRDCCREMLQLWLQINTDASWEQLIDALKSPAIQLPNIAENIEQNLTASGMWLIVLTRKEMYTYMFYCIYICNYVLTYVAT